MSHPAHSRITETPLTPALLSLRQVRWGWVLLGAVLAMAMGVLVARVLHGGSGWEHGLPWERTFLLSLERQLPWALDQVLLIVPWAGTNLTVMPVIVAFALWLAAGRRRFALAAYLVTVTLGSLIFNAVLKDLYDRPRPALWDKRGQFAWASFPSGHAIVAVSVLFTVAIVLHREKGWRWPYVVAALVTLVSFYSRLYLGVHWPTDLIGGALVGLVWLVCTLVAFAPGIESERRGAPPGRAA